MHLYGEVATLCASMFIMVLLLIHATGRSPETRATYAEDPFEKEFTTDIDPGLFPDRKKKWEQKKDSEKECDCGPKMIDFNQPRKDDIWRERHIEQEVRSEEEVLPPIRILSWTAMNMVSRKHNEVWFKDKGGKPSMDRCYEKNYLDPKYQCTYTNNKKYLNESDALLFRGRRMEEIPLPPPSKRKPHQKYIFWEFEPPYKVWEYTNLTSFNGVMNLTATYSRDSDIPYNTQYIDKICVRDSHKYKSLRKKDYTHKKRSDVPVAWFASVCQTQSKREKYVKQLKKYIKVDVFGVCGPKKCGSREVASWSVDKCDEKYLHNNNSYKFYLAFENSLCDDYITEKPWRTMDLDVVPIVYGTVDYSSIWPQNTYIDIRDFHSPKELATYLKYLNKNDEKYNGFLRRKNALKCDLVHKYMPWQCKLCQTLHELRDTTKIIHDLGRFWGSRRCLTPEIFQAREAARKADWDFT